MSGDRFVALRSFDLPGRKWIVFDRETGKRVEEIDPFDHDESGETHAYLAAAALNSAAERGELRAAIRRLAETEPPKLDDPPTAPEGLR